MLSTDTTIRGKRDQVRIMPSLSWEKYYQKKTLQVHPWFYNSFDIDFERTINKLRGKVENHLRC